MHGSSIRRFSAVLLALTIGSATATIAQSDAASPRRFQMELSDLQLVQDLDFGADRALTVVRPSKAPVQIAELQTVSIHDPRRFAQVSAQQNNATSGDGKLKRTGRWMKKHWWAPTLIGVAVGILVLEPFDDDDDERRRAQQMNP